MYSYLHNIYISKHLLFSTFHFNSKWFPRALKIHLTSQILSKCSLSCASSMSINWCQSPSVVNCRIYENFFHLVSSEKTQHVLNITAYLLANYRTWFVFNLWYGYGSTQHQCCAVQIAWNIFFHTVCPRNNISVQTLKKMSEKSCSFQISSLLRPNSPSP